VQSRRVVEVSVGIVKYYNSLAKKGILSEEDAKNRAKEAIKSSTYDCYENDNYLWINDFQPKMIMHPLRPELNGKDLSKIKDSKGTYIFNKIVELARNKEEGYLEYNWQYYDNENRTEPKISYITTFEPWGWILGTGVYVNDVESNVQKIRNRILLSALIIMFLVGVIVYLSADLFLAPMIAASNFANKISQGDLSVPSLQVSTNDELGDLLGSLNKMKDKLKGQISKLSRTNQELKKEKNKLQKYLDIAEVIFLVIDSKGKVRSVNKKGCEILGYREKEIIGENWFDNFIKGKDEMRKTFGEMVNGENKVIEYIENVVLTKDGEELTFVWHNTILKDESGEIEEILSSGMDVTERRLLKEKLEYNKLKTEFFANLSHELKTPLNLIFSALQMLNLLRKNTAKANDQEKFKKYTGIIKQNSYRLLRLVNNLVDITKIHANSFNLNLKNYDIIKIIREITFSVEDYIENKDRSLYFNSNVESRITACDPFNIERIMLNLLSNAVKFTDEGDKIEVNVLDREESILISVRDTGVGIPEDKQELIFERFGQADKSFTRNSEGSGIGLSIVKLLVEMHEGVITVKSEYEEGSEFIIELPARTLSEDELKNTYNNEAQDLTNRIDVEFSDIYDL
jgi:PAS domain S-box-containing protein